MYPSVSSNLIWWWRMQKNGKLLPVLLLLQFASFDVDWISKFPKRSKRRKKTFNSNFILEREDLVMNKCDVCCIHHDVDDEAMKRWWFHFTMLCAMTIVWNFYEVSFTFHSFMESRSSNRSLQCWQFILIQTMSIINLFFEIKLFFKAYFMNSLLSWFRSWHTRQFFKKKLWNIWINYRFVMVLSFNF